MSLEQLSPAITREIKMNRKKEVSKQPGSLEDDLRYSSGRKRRSCVKLSGDMEGGDKEEEENGNKRRKKTSQSSPMVLRTRQNAAKHFIAEDTKEKASQDAEMSLGFNNNENDVNEATEASEDELDLRLELDEEELLALQDEAKE